ncbi:Similar to Zinc finger protein 511; acc. no. Q7ZZ00 [Pyronema omphalodes CBS 100304]|uniref:Similar to Zinc finger protein 511 acc. no. Q7ZZ00 n=1 Tax=Pyronema omphalodes (strain CBS 100304) TaxID=1076935 RepID=U4LSK4_PYROM|nr:Similar to Zinc finger protein 511; acc. no. Q7ZZ00 [Pyronema omphalodes CBS 100304]
MSKRTRSLSRSPSPFSSNSTPNAPISPPRKESRADPASVSSTTTGPTIICTEAPVCTARAFHSYEEYEVHYAKTHTNRCTECRKNFPTNRFLELHIRECHDPLSQIKYERGDKIFGCFVEGCDRMCSTPFKRKRHLIDKHCFPEDYNFFVTKDGIDHSISLLNDGRRGKVDRSTEKGPQERRRPPKQNTDDMIVDSNSAAPQLPHEVKDVPEVDMISETSPEQDPVEAIARSMKSLRFVPTSIRFGRRGP